MFTQMFTLEKITLHIFQQETKRPPVARDRGSPEQKTEQYKVTKQQHICKEPIRTPLGERRRGDCKEMRSRRRKQK